MKKILIIDDDEIFEFITRELVSELYPDTQIVSYLSSTDGLEYLKKVFSGAEPRPDILFLDIRMPEMDGFELLDELKSWNPNLDIGPTRIYMLTSSLDANDNRRSVENPLVSGFISKPLEATQLAELMETNEPSI